MTYLILWPLSWLSWCLGAGSEIDFFNLVMSNKGNSASFRSQPTWTGTEWDPTYDAVLAASCCGLGVLSYWIPKNEDKWVRCGRITVNSIFEEQTWDWPTSCKARLTLGILKAHLGDRVLYVACNGGKEALMNDYGNKAMHAKRVLVRHLAISHTSTTRVRSLRLNTSTPTFLRNFHWMQ